MNNSKLVMVSSVVVLFLIGCSGRESRPTEKTVQSRTIKQGAPIQANADIGRDSAKISLNFASAGSNVKIVVKGIQGAIVEPELQVNLGDVRAGETHQVVVPFTVDDSGVRSQLALFSEGVFNGRKQTRAFSFSVGQKNTGGNLKASGEQDPAIKTDSRGRRIRVLPAK